MAEAALQGYQAGVGQDGQGGQVGATGMGTSPRPGGTGNIS
jgi:hypothetical protein